jgi:hypothetical protein
MATPLTADRMLAALRAEGLTVREHTGWRTHNRDTATGKTFGPVIGVLIHHTAGHNDRELCFNGRPDLPGPLCHAWLGKTDGLWLLGNGRANHAGLVDGDVVRALMAETSPLPTDDEADTDGNDVLYGIEIENLGDGRDPYPAGQYDQAVRWAAAICRAHGWSEKSVAGHKEVQPGKVDPNFDMNVFRAAVAARLAHAPSWNPNEENDMPTANEVAKAVLTYDGVIIVPGAPATNPTWTLSSVQTEILKRVDKANLTLAAQKQTIDELVKAVATLAANIGDLDPAAIVAELRASIESITIHLDVPES